MRMQEIPFFEQNALDLDHDNQQIQTNSYTKRLMF